MKTSPILTSMLTVLTLSACGQSAVRSSVASAPPAADAGTRPAEASTLHLARILSITAAAPANGKIDVTVTYLRSCGDRFEALIRTLGRPISLANPHLVVAAVMSSPGPLCEAADARETAVFNVDNIVGLYTFEAAVPGASLTEYHAAAITGIKASAVFDAPVDVQVTYTQTCGDEFIGLATARVSPESLANPQVGVLALVKGKGVLCAAAAFPVTKALTMPALHGVYSFLPVLSGG